MLAQAERQSELPTLLRRALSPQGLGGSSRLPSSSGPAAANGGASGAATGASAAAGGSVKPADSRDGSRRSGCSAGASSANKASVCAAPGCGATTDLRRCGGCGAVRYCSEACCKAHWRAHKADCRRLQAERAAATSAQAGGSSAGASSGAGASSSAGGSGGAGASASAGASGSGSGEGAASLEVACQAAQRHKEAGNALFRQRAYSAASSEYARGLQGLLAARVGGDHSAPQQAQQLAVDLSNNRAFCFIRRAEEDPAGAAELLEAAEELARLALRLDPASAKARYRLALALHRQGRAADARRELDRIAGGADAAVEELRRQVEAALRK